jgi:hypothetical protein
VDRLRRSEALPGRQLPEVPTFDNSATPDQDSHEHDVKTAPVDTEKLRAILGEAVKEAEENDPAKLKARIKELERSANALKEGYQPSSHAIAEAEQRGIRARARGDCQRRADSSRSKPVNRWRSGRHRNLRGSRRRHRSRAGFCRTKPSRTSGVGRQPAGVSRRRSSSSTKAASRRLDAAGAALPAGEYRVLTAIAQYREGVNARRSSPS